MKSLSLSLSSLVAAAAASFVLAATPALCAEITAAEIVAKSAENRTVDNSVQTLTMEIFDKTGRSRVRTITSKVKRGADGVAKSHVQFVEPEDVSGVQFLTIENPKGEDDQWLYMPAGGILNRISGSSRRGSFMGSDFSFEDLSVGQAEDGAHTLMGEESVTVDGTTFEAYKVESVPKPELKSAYTRIISFVDKEEFVPRIVEFFDKKGEHVKRMTIVKVKREGDVLVPLSTRMENLKRGTKTEVRVKDYKVNVDETVLPDSIFTPEFLQSEG